MIELTQEQMKQLQEIVDAGGAPDIETAINDAIESRWQECRKERPWETPEFLDDLARMAEESDRGEGFNSYSNEEAFVSAILKKSRALAEERKSIKA